MSHTNPYDLWVGTLLREGEAFAAVILDLTSRGQALGRARDRAEEALQEALSRVITRSSEVFSDYRHFRNTIIRSAINWAISDYRKRRKEYSLDGHGERLVSPTGGLRAWSPLVRRCLELLPDEERRLLQLHFEEGYTLDELADLLLLPDQRTDNARRLEVWRRLRMVLRQVRAMLLAQDLVLPMELAGHEPTP